MMFLKDIQAYLQELIINVPKVYFLVELKIFIMNMCMT